MKGSIKHLFALVSVALLSACALGAPQMDPRHLTYAPLEFKVPAVDTLTLANGIRLYLKEDHELPLVGVTAMVGAGSIGDPETKTGMGGLFAATLRTGGAGKYDPDQFDEALEFMAADMGVSTSTYDTTVNLSVPSKDLSSALDLLGSLLLSPRFDSERLELARRQAIEAIRRQNDEPGSVAQRTLMAALYPNHPLGRTPTEASIQAVKRQDLVEFHHRYFKPNNLWIAISGDFDRQQLLNKLNALFSQWSEGDLVAQTVPQVSPSDPPTLWVAKKDIPQTTILMGEVGIDKSSPDLHAVRVMNFILGGGGFNSRLMQEVRSNRGLAYSVYSYYQVGRRLPGPFVAGCETKSSSTLEVVELMRKIMTRMTRERVSEEELNLAKESLINSFVFGFTDSHDVVTQTMRLGFYDYPADYLESYRQKLAAVTVDDVLAAARKHLHPDKQAVVLVGEAENFSEVSKAVELPMKELPME